MHDNTLILSIFVIFTGAAIFSTLALYTRQSLLVAYMLLGIVLGPWGLKLVADADTVRRIGDVGIVGVPLGRSHAGEDPTYRVHGVEREGRRIVPVEGTADAKFVEQVGIGSAEIHARRVRVVIRPRGAVDDHR